MSTQSDIDKDAIAEDVERTVERTALRNVRTLVDTVEGEHAAQRRFEKRALLALGIIAVIILVLLFLPISGPKSADKEQLLPAPAKPAVRP